MQYIDPARQDIHGTLPSGGFVLRKGFQLRLLPPLDAPSRDEGAPTLLSNDFHDLRLIVFRNHPEGMLPAPGD